MKVKVFAQRQDDITVCKLAPHHRWGWSACYKEHIALTGPLEKDECIEFDLESSNLKKLGKNYFEKTRLEYLDLYKQTKFHRNKVLFFILGIVFGVILTLVF